MICGWPKTYPELKMGRGCEGSQQIITSSSKIGNDQTGKKKEDTSLA
jgi:hypothetical protein